jgi:2,5-diketo-D-gluconate reductase A
MPDIGLGTWPIADADAPEAVARAISLGYRLFDTAYAYGNEPGVGAGLRASGVPREELFVTTKLNGEWHGVAEAREAFHLASSKLDVDYIDLFLIHWPVPARDRYADAWRGMVELMTEGLVRAIGTSNFKPAHIDRLIEETGVTPDVNQLQLNPMLTRADERAYHARHGIRTQAWSPLGLGVQRERAHTDTGAAADRNILEDEAVLEIARRTGKTPAQVILRWHVEVGATALPKTESPARLAENIDIFDFSLEPDDVAAISALDRGDVSAVDSDLLGH